MQTRKNAVLLAFMMILTSLLLLVSLSANITHAAEKGSTLNGQTQQFNKGEGNPNSKDSKSSSKEASSDEEATSSKVTNSEDKKKDSTQSDHNVTINKIASDTKKQLAGALLQILDKNGNEVERFTTTGKASVFNLPKGEYTITELGTPEGYDRANPQSFTVNDENITTTIGTTVRAGIGPKKNEIYIDPLKEEIYIDGEHNQTELGYCFNIHKLPPVGLDYKRLGQHGVLYYRTSIGDGSPVNNYMDNPRQETDEDSLKAIRTIIWNGFASNPDNIQTKYGLTDDELYRITQRAIWYYTDKGLLNLGIPNHALDIKASKKVLLEALQDIVKTNEKSPIPNGMKIDFFTPYNDRYQSVLAASFTSTQIKPGTKPGKPVTVTLEDKPKHDTSEDKPKHDTSEDKPKHDTSEDKPKHDTSEDKPKHDTSEDKPKHDTPTTPEVEQPKATTPTTEEVVQPKATEQPSDNTATQKNNDDDFYAIPVKAQTTDKKAKVNHQKAVYKTNNSQKMPKATSVVYTTNNSEALPKTGAKQSALIVLIGLGMVVLSGFLYKKEF